jgi:hypothetical protein
LAGFGEAEQAALENHGYLLADAALLASEWPVAAGHRPANHRIPNEWTTRRCARRSRRARIGPTPAG